MKVLLTGANGLLGQELTNALLDRKHEVIGTSKGECRIQPSQPGHFSYESMDITDGLAIQRVLSKYRPDVIIHAAAMTQVDDCEINKIDCYNINVTATRDLTLQTLSLWNREEFTLWLT